MSASTPRVDPDLLPALRADLARSRFTVAGVTELLGPMASAALDREQALPAQRVTAVSDEPCATLVRLFTLGDPVDVREAAAALPTLGVDGAVALGLVAPEGDAVVALCDVRPYAADGLDWWVASDLGELATGSPLHPEHVLGVGGASTTLASWTPRPHVERALDVGTGSGVQALHLDTHADEVVVTDLSTRALAYARFTAALDEAEWDVRAGSMLEPVAGERFGLVVSNPPFVITPRSDAVPFFEYRDGGAAGDEVVADLVGAVAEHLEPGGIAQFLGNWEVPRGTTWTERVGAWLDGTGLDAWVVQREVQDPAEYAETWARDGGHHPGTADFNAMYAAWLDDFAARDVEAIGFGVLTLHRPRTRAATLRRPHGRALASRVPHGTGRPGRPGRAYLARGTRRRRRAGGALVVRRRRPRGAAHRSRCGRPQRHPPAPGRGPAPEPHPLHGDGRVRLRVRRRPLGAGRRSRDRRLARPGRGGGPRRDRRLRPGRRQGRAARPRTAGPSSVGENRL